MKASVKEETASGGIAFSFLHVDVLIAFVGWHIKGLDHEKLAPGELLLVSSRM